MSSPTMGMWECRHGVDGRDWCPDCYSGKPETCGESYDHDLRLIDEADGYATYECRKCGAEVTTEPDNQSDADMDRAARVAEEG